ncbi:hypothetical protein CMV_009401 [Castanea mollissima]|uniref:RNase H type-1 domain-containing protein n=1 Tax=Castanea mollissima TaxID=60419 RepID=A0A8J4REF1_9ROSI|nr:hypothetical protein CMV_009401 [Castanea mollissima]
MQPLVDTRELLSEHKHHVPFSTGNPKGGILHVPLSQANPSTEPAVAATNTTSTWKRIPRAKNSKTHKILSSPTLKRSGLDIYDHELPKKKKQSDDTAFHALWECEKIQTSWGPDFNELRQLPHQPATVTDLICRIGHEGKDVELFTVLAWFIWCRMNEFHFKEPSLPPDKLLEAASNSLSEFQTKQTDRPTQNKPAIQNWRPPPKDTYKINYDSAVFSESDEAGIGAVVRNERGEVMASLAEKIVMPSGGVEVIEAMTARRATLWQQSWFSSVYY